MNPPLLRNLVSLLFVLFAIGARADTGSGAVQVVVQLYRDFAWEAVVEQPRWLGHELLNQPRKVLARYFDWNLVALIRKDRQCVAKTREVCKLDFSPIWASQDPGASELKVTAGPAPDLVAVSLRHPGSGERLELKYRLVKTQTGWRIADIRYGNDSSLVSILSGRPQ